MLAGARRGYRPRGPAAAYTFVCDLASLDELKQHIYGHHHLRSGTDWTAYRCRHNATCQHDLKVVYDSPEEKKRQSAAISNSSASNRHEKDEEEDGTPPPPASVKWTKARLFKRGEHNHSPEEVN